MLAVVGGLLVTFGQSNQSNQIATQTIEAVAEIATDTFQSNAVPSLSASPSTNNAIATALSPAATTTLRPTRTARPTSGPSPTVDADPLVYDNFNNPANDGGFDKDLWRYWDNTYPVGFSQNDGVLKFVGQEQTGLIARKHIDLLIRVSTFYEARLMLSNAAGGSVTIKLHGSLSQDNWWSTQ
ncbi:MAG: hypothetical protein FJ030_17515 [Chloroflexi bacterium]|nr:hypothetical protein [Chloroflexota bacterium]